MRTVTEYTIEDPATGDEITFDWDGASPPTDADFRRAITEAKGFQPRSEVGRASTPSHAPTGAKPSPWSASPQGGRGSVDYDQEGTALRAQREEIAPAQAHAAPGIRVLEPTQGRAAWGKAVAGMPAEGALNALGDFGEYMVQAAEAVPGNIAKWGKAAWNVARHPLQAVDEIQSVGRGAAMALIPTPETADAPELQTFRQAVQPIVGAVENPGEVPYRLARWAKENPLDAVLIGKTALRGTGLGEVADAASTPWWIGEPAKKATAAAGRALSERTAPALYESAIKIPPSVPADIRAKAVNTGLTEEIPVSAKGLAKLEQKIAQINDEIASVIDAAKEGGGRIDLNSVVSRVDQLKSFYENAPNPQPFLDSLEELKAGVLDYAQKHRGGATIPDDLAQKMKQTVYALERKHYGEMKSVDIEGNKAIARGLKEELAAKYPELKTLNATDSALINLDEVLERAVNRIGNYDVIRFGDMIGTVGGAAVGGPVGAEVGLITRRIIDTPAVKSRLAIALRKAGEKMRRAGAPEPPPPAASTPGSPEPPPAEPAVDVDAPAFARRGTTPDDLLSKYDETGATARGHIGYVDQAAGQRALPPGQGFDFPAGSINEYSSMPMPRAVVNPVVGSPPQGPTINYDRWGRPIGLIGKARPTFPPYPYPR